jgi:imidazolonepropionase-like amidohydrolase
MFLNTASILLTVFSHLSYSCPHHLVTRDSYSSVSVRRYAPAAQSKTAITNVRVFDGYCFTPPQTIILEEGIITDDDEGIATTIDATGQFLIPGLIDNHIHINNVEGLENVTSWGITTAMNMACQNYTACALLKRQEGLADFLTAGLPAVGPNSTHARFQNLPPSLLVSDASNATDLAQWAVRNGSDYFKITLETNGPSYDLTNRLISEVHALDQQTMAHASDVNAYTQAIETRIDGIQHTPDNGNLTAVLVEQIKCNKQFVTPTLTIHAFSLDPPNPAILRFLRGSSNPGSSSWNNVLHNVRAMYHAGIPLLAGTDAVGPIAPNITLPFGDTLHGELQHFVEDVGMSPAEAINAATREAAKFHRLGNRGVIKAGMRADLVLLGSDPLVDISNTRDIKAVWAEGRMYAGKLAA